MRLAFGKKLFFLFLFLAAPLSIVHLVHRCGILVPFWDQWDLIPFLEKLHQGHLTLSDLWSQHNEHRIFFPRLCMLFLAYVTNWNIMYELYANLILGGLILLFLYLLLRQTSGKYTSLWLIIVLSFLVFSPVQWQNWTWGWQIQIFMNVLATVVAAWSVSQWQAQWKGILVALVAAIVASYSFSNGLVAWIAIGIFLVLHKNRRWRHVAIWVAVSILIVLLYFYKYEKPPYHPSLWAFMKHPYDFFRYVFAYLGSPLGFGRENASIITGVLLFLILIIGTIYARRHSNEGFNKLLPWICLALYAVLSAAVTGIGRVGFGVGQALCSRYTTISTLFVISVLVVGHIWIKNYLMGRKDWRLKAVIYFFFSLLIASYLIAFSLTFVRVERVLTLRKSHIESAAICLYNVDMATDDCLKVLFPHPGVVRERTKSLARIGMLEKIGANRQKSEGE